MDPDPLLGAGARVEAPPATYESATVESTWREKTFVAWKSTVQDKTAVKNVQLRFARAFHCNGWRGGRSKLPADERLLVLPCETVAQHVPRLPDGTFPQQHTTHLILEGPAGRVHEVRTPHSSLASWEARAPLSYNIRQRVKACAAAEAFFDIERS